jgi:DNA-binding NarL/FixJ family response regulator
MLYRYVMSDHGADKSKSGAAGQNLMSLSLRQDQLIRGLVAGKQHKEIADDLGISVETIKHHNKRLFAKLGVNNRASAVAKFLTTSSSNA